MEDIGNRAMTTNSSKTHLSARAHAMLANFLNGRLAPSNITIRNITCPGKAEITNQAITSSHGEIIPTSCTKETINARKGEKYYFMNHKDK